MPEVSQCIPQLLVSYTSSVCSLKSQKAQSQGIQEVTSSCRGINLQREPHCTAVLYLFRTFCKKMVHLLVWQRTGVPWLHRVGVPICQRAGVPSWQRAGVPWLQRTGIPALRGQVSSSQRTGVHVPSWHRLHPVPCLQCHQVALQAHAALSSLCRCLQRAPPRNKRIRVWFYSISKRKCS